MARLDTELVNRKLFDTRNKALIAIKNGNILCNSNIVRKASFNVQSEDVLEIIGEILKYVSKGGLKLEKAINNFKIDFKDKILLDIGSSTGGFTDCALQNGVSKVIAVDVGTNQMVQSLTSNDRVYLYENTDFRNMDIKFINEANIATIDVSFISVLKLLPKINQLHNLNEIICLIKPQFECGKETADKYKGLPLNKDIHYEIIFRVMNEFEKINFNIIGLTYSPIKGGKGNIEYLLYLKKNSNNKAIDIKRIINDAFSNI